MRTINDRTSGRLALGRCFCLDNGEGEGRVYGYRCRLIGRLVVEVHGRLILILYFLMEKFKQHL